MPLDFGSVPDWVEAIGTSGALIFLAEQHRRDRKRDRAARTAEIIAQADNEARQARLVSVTATWRWDHDGVPQEHIEPGWRVDITVLNDSSEPIRNVQAAIVDKETGGSGKADWWAGGRESTAVMRPGESLNMVVAPAFDLGEPAEPECYDPVGDRDGGNRSPWSVYSDRLYAGAEFVDAAGLRWFQAPLGTPMRLLGRNLEMSDLMRARVVAMRR